MSGQTSVPGVQIAGLTGATSKASQVSGRRQPRLRTAGVHLILIVTTIIAIFPVFGS